MSRKIFHGEAIHLPPNEVWKESSCLTWIKMVKAIYDSQTGEIKAWGENVNAGKGDGIIEVTDNALVGYLTTCCNVVDGVLKVDTAKMDAIKNAPPPSKEIM